MKKTIAASCFSVLIALVILPADLQAQTDDDSGDTSTSSDGWRGYLSIDYQGGRFVTPYARIVSVSQHDYIVDGGGRVYELAIDTTGEVVARFYYLESMLEDNPLKAGQIINDRLKDITKRAEDKTGQNRRSVIKHYPETTHAKMVEFNVSSRSHLTTIFDYIMHEWIEEGGRGAGRTLKIE